MIDCIDMVYVENETEMLWSIELGLIFNDNKIGQRRDWSYKGGLHQKWNWTIMTN